MDEGKYREEAVNRVTTQQENVLSFLEKKTWKLKQEVITAWGEYIYLGALEHDRAPC